MSDTYFTNEKDIQENIFNFLKNNGIHQIENEDGWSYEVLKHKYSDINSNYILYSKWYHDYIIAKDFIDAIKRLNPEIFINFSHLSPDDILNTIWKDFTEKYNKCNNNTEIYDLFFKTPLSIKLKNKDGIWIDHNYIVLDKNLLTECNRNFIRVIKEKTLYVKNSLNSVQRPDFAIYCNGLPFIVVEVKNPMLTSGLREAYKDYCQKSVYYQFLIGLCTDGKKASLVSSTENSNLDIWRNYGSNKKNDDANGLYDFIKEIVCNSRHMMILFSYGVFPIMKNKTVVLATARVQQYFAIKKVLNMLVARNNNNIEPFRYLIKHPPRSGKTITSRSIVHLVTDLFSTDFDKIFIQLPDKIITEQFLKDFKNFSFGNYYQIKEIKRRLIKKKENGLDSKDEADFSYEEAVISKCRGIYIMNMQKMDEMNIEEFEGHDDTSKVLFILDEVHTHQQANMAMERQKQFSHASYITFTATPRIRQGIDMSLSNYSTINGYLDELTNEDARNLDIVLPVYYKKLGYDMEYDTETLNRFSNEIFIALQNIFINDESKIEKIKQRVERELNKVDPNKIEIERYKIYREELIKTQKIGDSVNTIANTILSEINKSIMMSKINFIISFMNEKKEEDYTSLKKPKAFFVVGSQDEADSIMNNFIGNPYYRGYRFGVDYSSLKPDHLIDFNQVDQYSDIIQFFSSDKEDSIDILIIVEKYLKGYDNKNLCFVFCDCTIKEPSKLFQVFTRPGTKMAGKKHGYFIDMSFSNINYETFETAIKYYEEHEKIYTLMLTDSKLEELRTQLKQAIENIVKISGYMDLKDFRLHVKELKQDIFSNLEKDEQGKIIHQCYRINSITKQLGCCSNYGVDNYIDIIAILKGVGKILDRIKNEKLITKNEAEHLCRSIMDSLEISSYEDIINIDIAKIYDRPRDVNTTVAQFLKQELKINLGNGDGPLYNLNLAEKVENKKIAIEEGNWGIENSERNIVTEWTERLRNLFFPTEEILDDKEEKKKTLFDYEEYKDDWNLVYNIIETLINDNIRNNNIKHNEDVSDEILNSIRHGLIKDIRTGDGTGKKLLSFFFDPQKKIANSMIKWIIIENNGFFG